MKPADLDNEVILGDEYIYVDPNADDSSINMNSQGDYGWDTSSSPIPIDSRPPEDEDAPKKDNKSRKDSGQAPRIGEPAQPKDEKKNIFKRIFNKKDKKPDNDY